MELISKITDLLWASPLTYFILIGSLIFSIMTRFTQVRHFKNMVRTMFRGKSSESGISPFQAFTLALSGRVGTGNIAGVATAIALGGPGAVFWMWIVAIFGAATVFVESTLSQIYKVKVDGQFRGGPAYYIEKGTGLRWFGVLFAIATIMAVGIFDAGLQANTIALGFENAFGMNRIVTGVILVLILGFIIIGGIKRIAHVAQVVVPFMAVAYIITALIIMIVNIDAVPAVFGLIFKSAFALDSTFGGLVGAAIAWGVRRGIYSNEAGMGTGAHASAAAEVDHPVEQGLVQSFSVYIDTIIVCSVTAFIILVSGIYNVQDDNGNYIVNQAGEVEDSSFTQLSVDSILPGFGSPFIAIALLFFAFTTIMAFYYMAETNVVYLMKNRNTKWPMAALKVVMLASVFITCLRTSDAAWILVDFGLGIMTWMNMIALVLLFRPVMSALKDYEAQIKTGKKLTFNPQKLGIKNATFWEDEQERNEQKKIS
ncbi:alanine/glycine:cation symporter family protein [Virgibacillus sp. W0430]|uniref:alanine/glycine:cation symporter family protein n=1 Tax=Virgibacillus sp. W0430 TaxID=3391580 RepID=UPI003F48959E